MTNRVRLRAKLVARGDLRYTPAGVPVLQAGLSHSGEVAEAGIERRLAFELEAMAMGEVAQRLDRQALGTELDLRGFLAPRSRHSRGLRLHITEFTAL